MAVPQEAALAAVALYYKRTVESFKTLTPSPSPKGRGEQENICILLPLSPRERGLGGEGDLRYQERKMLSLRYCHDIQ